MARFYSFFDQILFFGFLLVWKCIYLIRKIIFALWLSKIKDISAKTWIAWLRKMKLFSHVDESLLYKRPEYDFFLSGAIHCENAIWKIQIFASNYYEPKYLRGPFLNICSTRPQNIWGLKEKSKICVVRFVVLCILSARPTNTKKVKLNINSNPNIFSWNHWFAKNRGSGGIQAQIPDCTVYIGIAA